MKILLYLLTFLSFSVFGAGFGKIIDYSDFVHMDYKQQVKTIKLVHSFLITYENNILYNPIHSKLKKEEKRKYQTYMKIMDFFIQSSYAATATNKEENKKCFYAGWVSELDDQKKCLPPKDINTSLSGKKYSHIKIDNNGEIQKNSTQDEAACDTKNAVICNPNIYGEQDLKVLCIESKEPQKGNTLCSQALEQYENQFPDEYKKTMEEIIEKAIAQNSNSTLFTTMEAMYDTCLCGGAIGTDAASNFINTINKDYAKTIFSSGSCASILYQTNKIGKQIRNSCAQIPDNDKELKKWSDFFEYMQVRLVKEEKSYSPSEHKDKEETDDFFTNLATANYEEAVKNNLCPILNNTIQLIASVKDDILSIKVLKFGHEVRLSDIYKSIKIEHSPNDEANKTIAKITKNEVSDAGRSHLKDTINYTIIRNIHPSKAQAVATIKGKDIKSNIVYIESTEPYLEMTYKDKILSVTIYANEVQTSDLGEIHFEKKSGDATATPIAKSKPESKTGRTGFPSVTQTYKITPGSEDTTFTASVEKLKASKMVPKASTPVCKIIKIKNKKQVSIQGTTHTLTPEITVTKDNTNFKAKIKYEWYDLSRKAVAKKSKRPKRNKLKGVESEKKKTKKKAPKKEAKYKNKTYNTLSSKYLSVGTGPQYSITQTPGSETSIVLVIVSDGKPACKETSKNYKVITPPLPANNNNPMQTPYDTRPIDTGPSLLPIFKGIN